MKNNPRLVRARRILERRTFLKALGLGLSLPVAAKMARFATAQTSAAPKRFVVIYIPHGTAPEHYNPRIIGGDPTQFDLDKTNESILGPLQPYKQYVNVYQGFKYFDAGGTHEGITNCLSGAQTKDDTVSRVTLDQVIGKGLGVKPLILGACSHIPTNFDLHGWLFWNGTPIEPEKSPVKAADTLFGNLGGEAPAEPVNADVQLRNELLKLTASEIQDLQTSVNSLTSEKNKLQTHLESIQALQATSSGGGGGGPVRSSCTTKPNLPTVEKVRQESAGIVVEPSGANDYFYQEANFRTLFKAQLEVAAQALICNAAPIIGIMPMYATCEFNFSFIGGSPGGGGWGHHNGISHTNPQAAPGVQWDSPISVDNALASTRATFGKAQRWFHEQIVENLVSILATTPDPAAPGSTVLDNSLIYLMSEIADGQMHNRASYIQYPQIPTYLPLVSIGKCGGALKTQQVLTFTVNDDQSNASPARPAADLYLTFARAMGVMDATFPNSTGVVEGVLT